MKKALLAAAAVLFGVNISHAGAFDGSGCTLGSALGFSCEPPRDNAAYAAWSATYDGSGKPIEWVALPGGGFMMGSPENDPEGSVDAMPRHEVGIRKFEMSRTPVTVAQYKECFDAGKCSEPSGCNWGAPDSWDHPVNCVNWFQANEYVKYISGKPGFEGARLPSEAEWEYAARSGGKDNLYPWGNEEPRPDKVVYHYDGPLTAPVCSKPAGNTEQGLCDMSGHVAQWLSDIFESGYKGEPVDGTKLPGYPSAWQIKIGLAGALSGKLVSLRGIDMSAPDRLGMGVTMRNDYRPSKYVSYSDATIGFRLARSIR